MVRIEIHPILLNPRIFILQRQGAGKWGWGVGVNRHTHRYVLILPSKRVSPFFGVKASHGEDSPLRPPA